MTNKIPDGPLANAPLVYVLAEIKFSAVLAVEEYIPQIQNQLREHFPRFAKSLIHTIQIGPEGSKPVFKEATRWSFNNKSNRSGFMLGPESVAFTTSEYLRYEDFETNLAIGLRTIADTMSPSLNERIGLRYLDAMHGDSVADVCKFVDGSLSGYPVSSLGLTSSLVSTETRAATNLGILVVRFRVGEGLSPIPQELQPASIDISEISVTGPFTGVLDSDHYRESTEDFDVDQILNTAKQLHDVTSQAFKSVITDHAIKKWA